MHFTMTPAPTTSPTRRRTHGPRRSPGSISISRAEIMALDIAGIRRYLNAFDFESLFILLGWAPPADSRPVADEAGGVGFERREVACLGGAVVFEITTGAEALADARTRDAIERKVAERYHAHLLIFLDQRRPRRPAASAWCWIDG